MWKCNLVDGLLFFLWCILLLCLEVSPWRGGGACGKRGRPPRSLDNWKCSRTSCSWETCCLVVCSPETWLSAFLPRPLDLGKATSRVFYLNPCAILAPWEAWFCVHVMECRLHGLPGHALAGGHYIKFQKQQGNMHLSWT